MYPWRSEEVIGPIWRSVVKMGRWETRHGRHEGGMLYRVEGLQYLVWGLNILR